MKKIYITPVCELVSEVNIQMFCEASNGTMRAYMDDNLQIGWEGKDEEGLEADANEFVWDHFDKGL